MVHQRTNSPTQSLTSFHISVLGSWLRCRLIDRIFQIEGKNAVEILFHRRQVTPLLLALQTLGFEVGHPRAINIEVHLQRRDFAIVFSAEGRVDLKRYGWDPSRDLTEEELRSILDNASNPHYEVSPQLLGLMRNDPASPLRGAQSEE